MLNPPNGEITRIIDENDSKDNGFIISHLYDPCLECMENTNYALINPEIVYGPVTMFLLNWGRMGRVMERPSMRGWEERLTEAIPRIADKLEQFRNLNLEDADLDEYRDDIIQCYNEISKVVKYTSGAKTLHLFAPNFFPLWDMNIRDNAKKESGRRINHLSNGYFEFMKVMQKFLKKNYPELLKLSQRHNRPKLKLMDEYFWLTSR